MGDKEDLRRYAEILIKLTGDALIREIVMQLHVVNLNLNNISESLNSKKE